MFHFFFFSWEKCYVSLKESLLIILMYLLGITWWKHDVCAPIYYVCNYKQYKNLW